MSNASDIARFLIEEHKPSLGKGLPAMSEEAIGLSIVDAVSKRFPEWTQDDLLHALLLAQELERADLGYRRRGLA